MKNTGRCAGTETAQVYVGDCEACVPRPVRELKGYERVTLAPGEQKRITIPLGRDAFAFYDGNRRAFRVEPGMFRIEVGASSRDMRLTKTITID